MPKKLNISSNERVDLNDFSRASSDYTQESDNFARKKLIQARKTAVASGFRIEISDQSSSPGEFTIFNGVGLNRVGNILNNEQQITDARTLTLTGAGISYFVEVEFVESESDVDSRAFWDPTFSGNTPPGKEFSLNVATRITPDWQLVSPVNTTAFEITSTPNSNKIPIAILTTNGSNEIDGFTAVNIATSLEEDVSAGTNQFKVLDSSLFPTTGTGSLDFGTPEAEAVTISANDRENGIITVLVNLNDDHQAGAVFKETTVTPAFIPEDKAAVPASEEDRRSRLFAGDEIRGSAVSTDPQDSSLRADLQVTSLKNYVDFLAAQLRELKFGNPRSDINSTAPPMDFSSTRHFDNAGSVTGARTATITIGDGTTSFGDLNFDALNTSLTTAITALDATFGGSIYVKAGTYAWGVAEVLINRPVNLVFDKGVEFAGTFTDNYFSLQAGHEGSSIKNMPAAPSAATTPMYVLSSVATEIEIDNCTLRLILAYTGATKNYIKVTNSVLESTQTSTTAIDIAGFWNQGDHAIFEDCTIRYNNTSDNTTSYLVDFNGQKVSFNRCVFDAAYSTGHIRGYVSSLIGGTAGQELAFTGCDFIETNTAEVNNPIDIIDTTTNLSSVLFDKCTFDVSWDPSAASDRARTLLYLEATSAIVRDCNFSAMGVNTIGNTSLGNEGHLIYLENGTGGLVDGCYFGLQYNAFGAPVNDFVSQVTVDGGYNSVRITNNTFSQFYKAISLNNNHGNGLQVDNNVFEINTDDETVNKDCYGVYVTDADSVTVSNNRFKIEIEDGPGTLEVASIYINDAIEKTITGNHIHTMSDFEDTYGIKIASETPESTNTITGNTITGQVVSSIHSNDHIGVLVVLPAGTSYSRSSITGNKIDLDSSGTGSLFGIQVSKSDNGDLVGTTTITGNSISVNTIVGTIGDIAGIRYQGNNATIGNNAVFSKGAGSGSANGFGIYGKGHNINVTGNTVNCASQGMDSCIYLDTAPAGSNGRDGNLSISNNTCLTAGVSPAIQIECSEGVDLHNFSVNGNNIISECPTTYTGYTTPFGWTLHSGQACLGILMIVTDATSPKGFSMCNNSLRITTEPSTNHTWVGLYITGSAIGEGPGGSPDVGTVCNNIVSRATDTQSLTSNSAAMKLEAMGYFSFMGNVVSEWTISGSSKATLMDFGFSVNDMSIIGNVMRQDGTVGVVDSIEISGSGSVIVGNVDRAGAGGITAGSDSLLATNVYNNID